METDNTTIRVKKTSRATINEFCARTHTDVIDFIEALTTELQKQLDLMEPNKRLLWMVEFYNKDNCPKTIIRLSDAFYSSLGEMPPELRASVLKEFGYDERFNEVKKPEEKKEDEK